MQTKLSTKVSGTRVNATVMEYSPKEMEITLKVTGLTTSEKDKALTTTTLRTNCSSASGLGTSPKSEFTLKLKTRKCKESVKTQYSQILMCCLLFLSSNWLTPQ